MIYIYAGMPMRNSSIRLRNPTPSRSMKTQILSTLALSMSLAGSLAAQGPMRVGPSGRASTEVTLTLIDSVARAASKPSVIRIEYGQPHLRGRKLLTDSLVPYDKLWRTGASAATTLTTDVDLVLGGTTLPRGKYVLQSLPTHTGWKLIVQKEGTRPSMPEMSNMPYDPAGDIARIDMRQSTLPMPLESLTIWLVPSTDPGKPHGKIAIAWGSVLLATDWSMK